MTYLHELYKLQAKVIIPIHLSAQTVTNLTDLNKTGLVPALLRAVHA